MRQDKLSQRLKLRRDSFDFGALIEGVSTLVEDDPPSYGRDRAPQPVRPLPEPATPIQPRSTSDIEPADENSHSNPLAHHGGTPGIFTATAVLEVVEVVEQAVIPEIVEVAEPILPLRPTDSAARSERTRPAVGPLAGNLPTTVEGALETLSNRLVQEVTAMSAALRIYDADEGGFRLAHVNQLLELLGTLDVDGSVSRDAGIRSAPPPGRAWPGTAWSVVEFADSPFSSLVPAGADEQFVRRLMYSAWGVVFDEAPLAHSA